MNIPFQYGYPLTRWLKIHHCMRQTREQPWIHKLRIVQLYEADYNSALKFLIERRLMNHSEVNGINSHQLYGSCKGKSSIEALITLQVIYNMARADRLYMVSLFNDLKGCYNRICPSLNTITTRRMGCPKGIVECQSKALRLIEHLIKTSFGVCPEAIK